MAFSGVLPSVFFLIISSAVSQSNPSLRGEPYNYRKLSPAVIIVVFLIAAFFFVAYLFFYFRYCYGIPDVDVSQDGGSRSRGLEASVVETFPTFVYTEEKMQKLGKGELEECSICLNEFEDEEMVRLLTKCDHLFHSHCIDAWLVAHVTCPVCRADVVAEVEPDLEMEQVILTPEPVVANQELSRCSDGVML